MSQFAFLKADFADVHALAVQAESAAHSDPRAACVYARLALSDLMMRTSWARRILFLADRVALVNQAAGVYKRFLPTASPVNLVTDKDATALGNKQRSPRTAGLFP